MDMFMLGLLGGGVGILLIVGLVYRMMRGSGHTGREKPRPEVFASLEELRALGELLVFKVVTKEIVTAKDHWFGEWGKKYLAWLASSRKMAMIFEFDIDFRYDLRDPDFSLAEDAPGIFRLNMPQCTYQLHIRDITFYDEQKARLMPWLLPDVINAVFGSGFDEEDRNRLKQEARVQAESLAQNLVRRLRSEVQSSARETMEMLARGFAANKVTITFKDAEPAPNRVDFPATAA